jgi:hypothetical protein
MAGSGSAGGKGAGLITRSLDWFRLVPKNCRKLVGGCFTGGGPLAGPFFFGLRCSGDTSNDFLRSLPCARGGVEGRTDAAGSIGAVSAAGSSRALADAATGASTTGSISRGWISLTCSTDTEGDALTGGGMRGATGGSRVGEEFLTNRSGAGTTSGGAALTTGSSLGGGGRPCSLRDEANVETDAFPRTPFGGSVNMLPSPVPARLSPKYCARIACLSY